ncbi:MAG: hypothetical protein A3J83_07320 [Elusimicrobia bacterium RIFOXYA2_FULL_40_6]|nr:MAG: hypothetical protein A3J83_07320 [Elusimicrobia bacterium RIFOXYA2_FULL_40_6]
MNKTIIVSLSLVLLCFSSVIADNVDNSLRKLEKKESRARAIEELKKIGKPAVTKLKLLAKDKKKDKETRISSIILLGQLKASDAQPDLEDTLKNEENDSCREASAIALGHLDKKESIPKLKQALNDQSVNVRMRSVWALAKLGDKTGKELAIKTLLEDKNVTGKVLASEALEAIGDKDTISQLQQYVNDGNVWTRIYAKLTIKKLGMVGLSESQRLGFLKDSLKDSQFEVNQWASIELAKIGTPEAINILKEVAKDPSTKGNRSADKVLMKLVEQGKISKEELGK